MDRFIKSLFIFPVRLYQKLVSPLLPPSCRFHPSCSQYMIDAIKEWGVARGLLLGVARVLRCHPWSEGGHDPVPHREEK